MNSRTCVCAAILFSLLIACGCVNVSGQPGMESDQSPYHDAAIKTAIISALLKKDAAKANDVNVHCYNGHVFLIGEADKEFRAVAQEVAKHETGVIHVTPHWFPPGTASTMEDAALETEIDAGLALAADAGSRRLAVDVWGGHVVLTGLGESQPEIDRAVQKIKALNAVKSVTNYAEVKEGYP